MDFSKKELAYLSSAKSISTLSNHRHKLGCVVVSKHRIVSSGHNSNTKCHKVQALLDTERFGVTSPGKLHAETSALIPFLNSDSLVGASIYVYREHADGSYALARPCPNCMKLIKQCGIKRMYYTTNEGVAMEKLM